MDDPSLRTEPLLATDQGGGKYDVQLGMATGVADRRRVIRYRDAGEAPTPPTKQSKTWGQDLISIHGNPAARACVRCMRQWLLVDEAAFFCC